MSDVPTRWTPATVYPDMWVDPAHDPRNTDGVSPDGELETLLDALRDYRLTLLMKCDGLDPEQLARRSGIRQSNISRIENGTCSPTISTLQQLASGMGKKLHIEFV